MCVRCKILEKKVLDVCMGPVKQCNLNIAPAFYMSQVEVHISVILVIIKELPLRYGL